MKESRRPAIAAMMVRLISSHPMILGVIPMVAIRGEEGEVGGGGWVAGLHLKGAIFMLDN